MGDNAKLIRDFCAAWSRMDADELAGYFTEDAIYHNIPMTPYIGRETIHKALMDMAGRMKDVRFEIKGQVAHDDLVMHERLDFMTVDGQSKALPVMAVFQIEGGKIKAWREYFDRSMAAG